MREGLTVGLIETTKNYPYSFGVDGLRTDFLGVTIGTRHFLASRWALALTGGYRRMERRDNSRKLPILAINQESLRLLGLGDGASLALGFSAHYLYPTLRVGFPIRQDPDFSPEIGFGLVLGLIFELDEATLLQFRATRWRGTGSRRLMGVEFAAGIGIPLGSSASGQEIPRHFEPISPP